MSELAELAKLRAVLRNRGVTLGPPDQAVQQKLVAGHQQYLDQESRRDLEHHTLALDSVRPWTDHDQHSAGAIAAVLRRRGRSAVRSTSSVKLPADACEQLDATTFTIQSDPVADSSSSDGLRRFARATAATKTLEVAAAVGEFGGQRWRSSDTFIFGYNQASASIGGYLAIPPHGPGSILTVSAVLRIEKILFGGDTTPTSGSSLLAHVEGDGSLPLRGTAAGWMRAGFTLHGSTSSVGTQREFVSGWANRDGADSRDDAPDGLITLSRTVALGASTTSLAVFVNLSCTTFAEESDELRSAFTICECRNKPVTERNGLYYLPPARIRLSSFNAQLCELPVLATAE